MKKVYICSPCRSATPKGFAANITHAKEYCRQALASGAIPIAPHLFYTSLLDDAVPADRALGLKIGLELLGLCDELWYWPGPGGAISAGMWGEIERAEALLVPVKEMKP